MANYKSSIRRIRKNEKARVRNRDYSSRMKTAIKNVLNAGDKETAERRFKETVSMLDKLASKGLIHRNKAANQKSRLALYIDSL